MPQKHVAIFNTPKIVAKYARLEHLQRPEQTIFSMLYPELPQAAMLDIGAGGGRTTLHFAPHVRRYVGVDCAQAMVDACQRRFAGWDPPPTFCWADARDLRAFGTGEFDLVLFSFNGIDCVSHEDRQLVLAEIARVLRPGGTFVFSSHNLRSLVATAAPKAISPGARVARLAQHLRLRARNLTLPTLLRQPHAMVRDLPGISTYYVTPPEQLRQLLAHGFTGVRLFALSNGEELPGEMAPCTDPWIYYLCQRR